MNQHYSTPQNANISNIPRNNSKEKMQKYISSFSNFYINKNKNFLISDTQRNLAKFKSQKKPRQKDSYVKHFTENNPPNFFENNKNYSLMRNNNNSKSKLKNKQKNKSHGLLKANLEIETNPSNNIDNISTKNNSRINTNNNNNKRYRKYISDHDLVNNILNTFTNYNFPKNTEDFIQYIADIFQLNIKYYLTKVMNKESKNRIINENFLIKPIRDFINLYEQNSRILIEPVIDSYILNFMNYQKEIQKQKNININPKNIRNSEQMKYYIKIYLYNNYKYIMQKHFIYNVLFQKYGFFCLKKL